MVDAGAFLACDRQKSAMPISRQLAGFAPL
jgi:hypothetical protein